MLITILNLNMGNIGSIPNMLKRFDCQAIVTSDPEMVLRAEKLILPGVGAFDAAMNQIEQLRLRAALDQKVLEEKIPTLGICLGMQLLGSRSEEGLQAGLNWIPGDIIRFRFDTTDPMQQKLKVPHMGWNYVRNHNTLHLTQGFAQDPRFYFVHSYHYDLNSLDHQTQYGTTHYGYDFPAVIQRGNVLGAQFHPEKSHRFGLKLFENFIRFNGQQLGETITSPEMRFV